MRPACRRCVVGGQDRRAAWVPALAVFVFQRACRENAGGTSRGRADPMAFAFRLRGLSFGERLRELLHRLLAKFQLRLAIRARQEVAPTDLGIVDGLADEPTALALGTHRRHIELYHHRSAALLALAGSMKKVSVDEPASLRNGRTCPRREVKDLRHERATDRSRRDRKSMPPRMRRPQTRPPSHEMPNGLGRGRAQVGRVVDLWARTRSARWASQLADGTPTQFKGTRS